MRLVFCIAGQRHGTSLGWHRQIFPILDTLHALLDPLDPLFRAVIAAAHFLAQGVELSVLVEAEALGAVLGAEDVAAVAAVVAALEEVEFLLADVEVADLSVGVGFPVLAGGWTGDLGEVSNGGERGREVCFGDFGKGFGGFDEGGAEGVERFGGGAAGFRAAAWVAFLVEAVGATVHAVRRGEDFRASWTVGHAESGGDKARSVLLLLLTFLAALERKRVGVFLWCILQGRGG